jgi:hypothetical protein
VDSDQKYVMQRNFSRTTTVRGRLFKLDETEFDLIENKFSCHMADGY